MLAPRKKLWSSPPSAIDLALDLVGPLNEHDVVYDVGCGDGRVLIRMAEACAVVVVDNNNNRNSSDDDDGIIENNDNDEQRTGYESQLTPPRTTDETMMPSDKRQQRCHRFVGIEISPERASEARENVRKARQSKRIPPHVSVDILCANALDEKEVNYGEATVIFLYLVPRGLRLIKDIVWPTQQQRGRGSSRSLSVVATSGSSSPVSTSTELKEDSTAMPMMQDGTSMATLTSDETNSFNTTDKTTTSDVTNSLDTTNTSRRRRRRIVTYMSPFEDTPYARKECCTVEHQEGAAWPLYLYHVR